MAGMGDTSGDIQPVSAHVKDILQITRDSEMMQSYVRIGKVDDSDDEGISGEGSGGCGGGDRSDTDDGGGGAAGYVGGDGLSGGGGGGGKVGRTVASRRHRRRRKGGVGAGGGGGAGLTTTFDELTEEFKTRKSGSGGGGGGGGTIIGFGGGWSKRHKRDSRSRLLEEVYTDKDRAAAVNLGTRDIKASLRMKRRQDRNRTLHIPSTAESPTLLALARHCINDVDVALEFIDKVRGKRA